MALDLPLNCAENEVAYDPQLDHSRMHVGYGAGPLTPDLYGSAVAEQYAAMIARYWRELRRQGCVNSGGTLDVMDFCPGFDTTGALLMSALRRRIRCEELPAIRYLPWLGADLAINDRGNVGRLFLYGRIDMAASLFIHLQHQSQDAPYVAENPLVVIAHDAWSKMHQELFAMHYGKLLRANLVKLKNGVRDEDENLWEPAEDSYWDNALRSQLAHYRLEFNSSPLIYPRGALNALASLRASAPYGSLVLSCSVGCASEILVRLTSFAKVTDAHRDTGYLPVNLHLIASWTRALGGDAREIELSGQRVLQVLLFGDLAQAGLLDEVLRCVDPAVLDSASPLAEVSRLLGAGVSLDTRLSLLQMSKFEPSVFISGASDILRALGSSADIDRRRWRDALEQVWNKHLLYPADTMLYHWIAQAAMHCGHWGFARRVLQQGLHERGENANDLANLAWCESRTGRLGKGMELVTRALTLDPGHALAREVNCRLGDRLAQRDVHWRVELRDPELPILLEPLDTSHAQALSHQYRDGQIAVMTGLPAMSDPDKVRQWIIESDQDPGRVNFAVMHIDWGFVGFINLAVSGHAAFFCFWTGIDFQGQGFATAAGRLACRHAADRGVPVILTSAYKDNHRSIRALMRLGFHEMTIRARPPDHERIFFHLSDSSVGTFDFERELVAYYRRENLPMDFNLPDNFSLPPESGVAVAGSA